MQSTHHRSKYCLYCSFAISIVNVVFACCSQGDGELKAKLQTKILLRWHSQLPLAPPLSLPPPSLPQAHAQLAGKDKSEAMEEVIQICRNGLSYEGIFFDVEVSLLVYL